jgi:large subunit ribosomal protein L4
MTSVTVQNPTDAKAKSSKVELPAEIFDAKTNVSLIHQVVVAQLAAARQGTHKTKTRGEVRGGGRKPYRQKGTGRARQGSTRAPQFAGGGVVHGPTPRDYAQRTPKKMKAAALRGALSDRARNDRVHVVSGLVTGETPSTKLAAETLAKVSSAKNVLLVVEVTDDLTWKSVRNLTNVHVLSPGQLNTYDVLISDDVVFTKGALDAFLAGPAKGKSAKGAASSDEVDDVDEVAEPSIETTEDAELAAQSIEATKDAEVAAKVSTEKPAKKAPAKKAPAKKAAAKKVEPAGEAEVAELSSSDEPDAGEAVQEEDA